MEDRRTGVLLADLVARNENLVASHLQVA
jgi:hypothetical protein